MTGRERGDGRGKGMDRDQRSAISGDFLASVRGGSTGLIRLEPGWRKGKGNGLLY